MRDLAETVAGAFVGWFVIPAVAVTVCIMFGG